MTAQIGLHGVPPIFARKLLNICLIFLALGIGELQGAEAPTGGTDASFFTAVRFNYDADYATSYLSGDVTRAVAIASSAAANAETSYERSSVYLDTMFMCERVNDFGYVEATLFQLLPEIENLVGAPQQDILQQAQVWIARFDIWRGESARAEQIAIALSQNPHHEFSKSSYLILQDVMRWVARSDENYIDAREAGSRLIAKLVADPTFLEIEKAQYLSSALQHIYYSGDSDGAQRFYIAFDEYIQAQLAADAIGLSKYLYVTASLSAESRDFNEAIIRARQAASAMAQSTTPEIQKNSFLSQISNVEAISALFVGDSEAALDASARNPTLENRDAIIARGQFESADELVSSVIDLLVRRGADAEVDQQFMALFSEQSDLAFFGLEVGYYEPYRLFGRALLSELDAQAAQQDILSAAELLLAAAEDRQRAFSSLFPLPNVAEQLAIGSAIYVLALQTEYTTADQNIIISALDTLGRSPKQLGGDALNRISSLQSEREQRIFQSYNRLAARRSRA